MSSNCLNQLTTYAEFLNNNTGGGNPYPAVLSSGSSSVDYSVVPDTQYTDPRPHPLFWSTTNCEGTLWPYYTYAINDQTIPIGGNILSSSVYIPAGWEVTFTSGNLTQVFGVQASPRLLSDLGLLFFPDSTINLQNAASVTLKSKNLLTGNEYSLDQWMTDKCMGLTELGNYIGGQSLRSYQMGSNECDVHMASVCTDCVRTFDQARNKGLGIKGCVKTSANPNCKYCACLKDECENKFNFCTPDAKTDNCTDDDSLAEFIPVTCFGKECSQGGSYRFGRMMNRPCNIQLCKQVIDITGEKIASSGGSELFCGNVPQKVTAQTTPAVITPAEKPKENKGGFLSLSHTTLLLIGMALVVLIVMMTTGIILLRPSGSAQVKEKLKILSDTSNNNTSYNSLPPSIPQQNIGSDVFQPESSNTLPASSATPFVSV